MASTVKGKDLQDNYLTDVKGVVCRLEVDPNVDACKETDTTEAPETTDSPGSPGQFTVFFKRIEIILVNNSLTVY